MEETLALPRMTEIDLMKNLEKISSGIPNRILFTGRLHFKKN